MVDFVSLLDKDSCTVNISGRDRESVLQKIAAVAVTSSSLSGFSADMVYEQLLSREMEGSTGVGKGIAIPHARIEGMQDYLVFIATSKRGVNFQAIDHKKVHAFFVILGPADRVNDHLKILAAISRVIMASNVIREILAARSSVGLYEAFLRNVRAVDAPPPSEEKKREYMALFIVLYIEEFLYEILEFFIEEGIDGATVLESSGMGRYISNIPLFASFIGFMNEDKNRSSTIVAMVPADRFESIVSGIEEITGDLDKKEGAMIFAFKTAFTKGSMRMM